jgi:chaperonin GroEL
MPRPDVVLGEKSRAGMLRGFESMARLLAITLGPIGGNIANDRDSRSPELLRDAATVARRIIQLPDRLEDAGAMLMRHMVWRVREEVGDGSATTAVLAIAIAREVERMIAAGANPAMLRRGIEKGAAAAVKALEELSIPLEGEQQIAAVATAATGDAEIGKILGEIYDVLGPNAHVVTQPYIATFHDRTYHEGARFKSNFVSPYLVTDQVRKTAVLDDPYVVVADLPFETPESVQNVLQQVVEAGGKTVFIVCKNMSDKAIGVLVANNERGTIRSFAVRTMEIGDMRREVLRNLSVLVGATLVEDKTGITAEQLRIEGFGRAERIISTPENYTVLGGKGDKEVIRERARILRKKLREARSTEERNDLRKLAGHFSAGIGELRIGALTAKEREELTKVAEEAMKAVMAGMESGIVPGGGAAYLACIPAVEALELQGDEAIGAKIVARALEEPMRCIAANAGAHPPLVIADARKAGPNYGFEVRRKEIVDMIAEGIVDPTMVATRALQLAASGAVMLLTTDAIVLHRKPEENFQP